MGDVQLVKGSQSAASTASGPEFVEVLVTATGETEVVPAEWVGHEVLGAGIEAITPEPELVVDVDEVGPAPTSRSTTAELAAYAEKADIDLGEASTNPERLAVIEAAIAERQADVVDEPPAVDPDVQLVAGDEHTEPLTPSASDTTYPDDTEPSDENPPSGEEN